MLATGSQRGGDIRALCGSNNGQIAAAADICLAAQSAERTGAFLSIALSTIAEAVGGDYAALAHPSEGRWEAIAENRRGPRLPGRLAAEVLDREQPGAEGPWAAAPLAPRAITGELLLVHFDEQARSAENLEGVSCLAGVLGVCLAGVRQRASQRRRVGRLKTMLEIAQQWNQADETEPLLNEMAEAATRLLKADRASIFLWDKAGKTLVGRPALGVEGGELRIPDDKGIVGEVVQTGESRRVDAAADQDKIDRKVDLQLGYQTRTLLCVPLRGRNGELFGAFEMINKLEGNFTDDDEEALSELASHAAVALENTQQREHLLSTQRQIAEQAAAGVVLIGKSTAIEALRSTLKRVANTDLAILVQGENGTGKEVVSQSLHYLSARRDEPFVAVNCAAITETLLESELFGHEKGAFTDAHQARAGKFELASGGTIFLDEIGDLSLSGQAKLLRVLEEKIVVRVGGSMPIHTDARVIAATNQDLPAMVRAKKFREDLFFRLNVVTIELPPLRERPEDVMLLAEHFLSDFCRKARRKPPKFSAVARRRLESHTWPGNVRELRNLMERLAYLSSGDRIEADDLVMILSPDDPSRGLISFDLPLAEATSKFQADFIQQAVGRNRGNMSEAAKQLGLHRSNLYRKMRHLGMADAE